MATAPQDQGALLLKRQLMGNVYTETLIICEPARLCIAFFILYLCVVSCVLLRLLASLF